MRYNVQKTHEVSLILFMKGVFTMSEKKHHVTSLYERIPAVAELNKVPGFDPRKLLRRTVSRTGNEEVLKLDLRYKKLWFRLAHPHGRLKLNALRITEQLAIFEAGVYLDRSDSEPHRKLYSRLYPGGNFKRSLCKGGSGGSIGRGADKRRFRPAVF